MVRDGPFKEGEDALVQPACGGVALTSAPGRLTGEAASACNSRNFLEAACTASCRNARSVTAIGNVNMDDEERGCHESLHDNRADSAGRAYDTGVTDILD